MNIEAQNSQNILPENYFNIAGSGTEVVISKYIPIIHPYSYTGLTWKVAIAHFRIKLNYLVHYKILSGNGLISINMCELNVYGCRWEPELLCLFRKVT